MMQHNTSSDKCFKFQVYFCIHLTLTINKYRKAYISLQKVNRDVDAIKNAELVTDGT